MTSESLASRGSDPTESFSLPIPGLPDNVSSVSIDVEVVSASSGNERRSAPTPRNHGRSPARSDAASDFRSVIDDLTLENRKLKEELRRLQQTDSPSLHMDQILEVKCHGLSATSKRDLESVLVNFATSSKGSSCGSVTRGKRRGSGIKSTAHSSSSGLRSRGTMQTLPWSGAGRSSPAASPLVEATRQPAGDEAEDELHQGLGRMRSHLSGLGDKEKKEVVVRRLEQLFTGKSWGYAEPAPPPLERASTSEDVRMTCTEEGPAPALREAHIDHDVDTHEVFEEALSSPVSYRTRRLSENASDSAGSRDLIRLTPRLPKQRATRPHELDPRRPQSSAQNMAYLRHLGIGMPDVTAFSALDVSLNSEGWVHLNLLSSMAQLSMLHVTLAFVRNAVAEKSDKLQLSNDGQMVHWRGGTEGTKFGTSDGDTNPDQVSPRDGNGTRASKRQRGWEASDEDMEPEAGSRRKVLSTERDFHYKPMFIHPHHDTPPSEWLLEAGPSPLDDTESTYGWTRENKVSDAMSQSDTMGGPRAPTPKRSRDGAIYFYAGAPFYTDLSGDCHVDTSSSPKPPLPFPDCHHQSGSSSPYQYVPTGLSDPSPALLRREDDDATVAPELSKDWNMSGWDAEDEDSGADDDDEGRTAGPPALTTLVTSGLAGVVPLDHFVVSMLTRQRRTPAPAAAPRPWSAALSATPSSAVEETEEGPWNCAGVARRVVAAAAATAQKQRTTGGQPVYVEYVGGGNVQQLPPVPPPPPVHMPSSDSSSTGSMSSSEEETSEECFSWEKTERPPRLLY